MTTTATTTSAKPPYWVERRPGEPVGAWALRLTAAYVHDSAVEDFIQALRREQISQELLSASHDMTTASTGEDPT